MRRTGRRRATLVVALVAFLGLAAACGDSGNDDTAADDPREDGSVPPVDIIHLHHGVWINQSRHGPNFGRELVFAAGEEKTISTLPEGYGYRYDADDNWIINYMIHNQVPAPDQVYLT